MWWRYNLLCLLFLAAFSGCGFTPIHAKNTPSGNTRLSHVEIGPIAGRPGQIMKTELENSLDPESSGQVPFYRLETTVAIEYIPIIIETDGTVSRYRIDITVPLELREIQSNAVVYRSRVRRSVSYTVADSDYTSYISSSDAMERGIKEAAYDVVQRISAFMVKP